MGVGSGFGGWDWGGWRVIGRLDGRCARNPLRQVQAEAVAPSIWSRAWSLMNWLSPGRKKYTPASLSSSRLTASSFRQAFGPLALRRRRSDKCWCVYRLANSLTPSTRHRQQNLLATRTFGKKHSVVFGSLWHPFLANSLRAHRLWETRCREDRFRIALLVSLR